MILYGIILLLVAGLMTILAVRIYKGHTELIHNYHQTNVTDQAGYGKAMGKALMTLAGVMTVSGGVSFFGDSAAIMWSAVGILVLGLPVSVLVIVRVQKKYNGSVFG